MHTHTHWHIHTCTNTHTDTPAGTHTSAHIHAGTPISMHTHLHIGRQVYCGSVNMAWGTTPAATVEEPYKICLSVSELTTTKSNKSSGLKKRMWCHTGCCTPPPPPTHTHTHKLIPQWMAMPFIATALFRGYRLTNLSIHSFFHRYFSVPRKSTEWMKSWRNRQGWFRPARRSLSLRRRRPRRRRSPARCCLKGWSWTRRLAQCPCCRRRW